MRRLLLLAQVVFTALVLCPAARAEEASDPLKPLLGSWKDAEEEASFLLIGKKRMVVSQKGYVQVARVETLTLKSARITIQGTAVNMVFALEGDRLTLTLNVVGGSGKPETTRYVRLLKLPEALDLSPLVLPKPSDLPPERLEALKRELGDRHARDQAVRLDKTKRKDMAAVDRDNTAWLRKLVLEIGWIDASRFGKVAAEAAFLLVQHSGDIRLMGAALPVIEEDVKAKRLGGEPYSLLYDRLQLRLGRPQRYGTQIVPNAKGEFEVPDLDWASVEEHRKAIGLSPLEDYLKLIEKYYGKKVKRGGKKGEEK